MRNFVKAIQIIFFTILLAATLAYCEIYTATNQLTPLLHTEAALIESLEQYIALQQFSKYHTLWQDQKLHYLNKHVINFKKHHLFVMRDPQKYFENPLNAYLIIKKLTVDLKNVLKLLETDDLPSFSYEDLILPNKEDLMGASIAIARLQDVYDLKTSDLARGELNGVKEAPEFSASDCFQLGKELFEIRDTNHAFLWLREALGRLNKNEAYKDDHQVVHGDHHLKDNIPVRNWYDDNTDEELNHIHGYEFEYVHDYELDFEEEPEYDSAQASLMSILEYMAYCSYDLKNYALAANLSKNLTSLFPSYRSPVEDLLDDIRYETSSNFLNGQNDLSFLDDLKVKASSFNNLCRGHLKPRAELIRTLKCYYSDNGVPFLKISPFKVEELHSDPVKVLMFHDVLSENETIFLRELSQPKLHRNNEISSTSQFRISKSAFFYLEDPIFPVIEQRITDMTSLDSAGFEQLHIANYGLGGQYLEHYDFGTQTFGLGNRIATVLFYLSDVAQGGATVFIHLNIAIRPKKGAAVFWYNLLDSGEGNKLTLHAGCPVLQGSKWIATQWIHEYHQEFIRPCGLKRTQHSLVRLVENRFLIGK